MKKLLIILTFISYQTFAGWVVGGTYTRNVENPAAHIEIGSLGRYSFGMSTLPVDGMGVRAEFLYMVKGRSYSATEDMPGYLGFDYLRRESSYKEVIPYFEIPVLFSFPLVGEDIHLEFGPSIGYRLRGRRVEKSTYTAYSANYSRVYEYEETTHFGRKDYPKPDENSVLDGDVVDKRPIKNIDFGLNLGAMISLGGEKYLNVRYNYGLRDVWNNNYHSFLASDRYENFQTLTLSLIGFSK